MTPPGELRAKLFELSRMAAEIALCTTNLISSYWEFESKNEQLNSPEQTEWQARFEEAVKNVEIKRDEYNKLADEVSNELWQLGVKVKYRGPELN